MYNAEKFDIMSIDEKHRYFMDSCGKLRRKGVFKLWKDLAEILDVSPNSISGAKNMNPDYLTSSLLVKLEDLLSSSGESSILISNFTNSNVVGNGQLHVNSPQPPESPEEQSPDEDMVPVIPTNLYKESEVNIVEYINDNEENVQWSPAVQQFPKTDVFYTVQTMAMYPHLHQGDILALKAVKRSTPIVNGELYAVDSVDLGILVRFIYDRGDRIELRGSESSDRFEPIFIDKADVYNIFRVVGLIRTNI